jgi:WD40 repeat protein
VVEAQAIADSAKAAADSAMALAEKAGLLAEEKLGVAKRQSQIADSLRQEADRLQGLVKSRAHAADSLQKVANWATKLADSLTVVAENNLREAERLRGLSTALFLAAQAVLPPSLQPDDTLAVRLARGAYFLNLNNGGRNDNEIYEALRSALNRPSFKSAGGPLRSGQHKDWGETVAFSPDGNWVASGGADSSVVVWSFGQNRSGAISHYGHKASVGSVAFDPDGRILASGSDDHKIGLWMDWKKTDAVPRMLEGPKDRIWSVAFSRNKMLAAGCADSTVILWNIEREGGSPTFLKQHQGSVRSVAFSPDGLMLASGSTDATIRLWDIRTLDSSQPRVLNSKSRARVRAVAFSPDGRFLAAACEDGAIRLWNLSQLDEAPKELGGHEGPANAVAFSSNDSLLASAGADRTARIWNLNQRTKGPVITLKHEQWVWAVAFSPDGKRLATASSDKTIRIWASSSEALVGISQEKVERDLTRQEWEQVVGEKITYEPKQLRVRGGK